MTIKTRYRDIPWEEMIPCVINPRTDMRGEWERRRGKPVELRVPACAGHAHPYQSCKGPFFLVVAGGKGCVCPHIVEIGD